MALTKCLGANTDFSHLMSEFDSGYLSSITGKYTPLRSESEKLFGFSTGGPMVNCTTLPKAAKPVWAEELSQLPCLTLKFQLFRM